MSDRNPGPNDRSPGSSTGSPGTSAWDPDALIIGAGVSGLTTGICLAEAGLRVKIEATLPAGQTTSAVAGAIWGAHLVGLDDRVPRWGRTTLARFRELAEVAQPDEPAQPAESSQFGTGIRLGTGSGIRLITGREVSTAAPDEITSDTGSAAVNTRDPNDDPAPDARDTLDGASPDTRDALDDVCRCTPGELPPGYTSGWRYTAPVISMPVYLSYLQDRFDRAGGQIETGRTFGSLADAAASTTARVIVNCAGMGASRLVPDAELVPVRGQIVVAANPGIADFFIGHADGPGGLVYLFPHDGTVVLGGTEERGNSSREPDPAIAQRILRNCATIEPRLRDAEIIAHKVGLRPARPFVRLEAEEIGDGRLMVHNYGHGGAGVSLSWGCAADAARLVLAEAG